MSKGTSSSTIDSLVALFVDTISSTPSTLEESIELEAKFATRGRSKITHIQYNNVIKKLISTITLFVWWRGFKATSLRCQSTKYNFVKKTS